MSSETELSSPSKRTITVYLLPVAVPVLVLFGGGLLFTIAQSFGRLLPYSHDFHGFEAYAELFNEPWFLRSLGYTAYVALSSATIAIVAGTALAYGIWMLPLSVRPPAIIYKIPLVLPHIAVAFVTLLFFSGSGILASITYHLGIIDLPSEFPSILFGGNGLGLIAAYVYKEASFVALLALGVLYRIDQRLIDTARNLGAGNLMVFFRVVLPHLKPILHTAFIILFLYSFGAFDIPYLLSESDPQMLSVFVYSMYFQRPLSLRPISMAALVIMSFFSIFFIILYSRVIERAGVRSRKL